MLFLGHWNNTWLLVSWVLNTPQILYLHNYQFIRASPFSRPIARSSSAKEPTRMPYLHENARLPPVGVVISHFF